MPGTRRRRPTHATRGALWAACLCAPFAAPAQVPPQAPPLPPGLGVFAWLPVGLETDAEALAALRSLGVSGVMLGPHQDTSLAVAAGLAVLVDQLVGKGILELREPQFAPLRDAYERERDVRHLVRPGCLSDPSTARELRQRAIDAMRGVGLPCAVSLGDEISTTRHANPLDFSFSPPALDALRAAARARHGDLEALNTAWGTSFADWDAVVPPTADQARSQLRARPGELPVNLVAWAHHRRATDASLARTVASLVTQVHGVWPVPCGITGIQQPSAYGGSNFDGLLRGLDFFEAYDIGGARDLAMGCARGDAWQLTTVFAAAGEHAQALLAARFADALAHGIRVVVPWHAGLLVARTAEGVTPTVFGRQLAAAIARAAPLAAFAGARLERSPIWLVEEHAAVQGHWMLDSAGDGDTWIRRLSSYEETHSTSLAARLSWVRLLEDLGRQGRFVPAARLATELQRATPRVVVLPAQIALSDAVAATLAEYVRAGGVLLADCEVGFYDDELRRRARPALDEVFGLEARPVPSFAGLFVREGVPAAGARLDSGAAVAERDVRAAVAERMGAISVQCEHRFGRGLAVYLNLAVCEYGRVRLDPARLATARDLRRRVRRVLDAANAPPPFEVEAAGLPTCIERAVLRGTGDRTLLAIRVNALEAPETFQQLLGRGSTQVEILFQKPVRLRRLADGEALGPSASFKLWLDPAWGIFVEVLAP